MPIKPPQIVYYGMKQLYVADPDGYGLCFQWRVNEDRPGAAPAEEASTSAASAEPEAAEP